MCRGDLPDGHLWVSQMMAPSMNMECDSCASCGFPRPGFIDPAAKADEWKEADAREEEAVQGLPTDQQETCPEPGPKVRDVLASGEEAA